MAWRHELLLLSAIALGACSEAQPSAPLANEPARAATAEPAAVLARRVAFRRHGLHSRWSRIFPLGHGVVKRACPAAVLDARPGTEPLIMARDARVEARHLLPLLLTERLVSAELSSLEADPAATVSAENMQVLLDELSARHLVGVFHVLDYQAPRRIRRLNHPRPEWIAGVLVAQFAVYDLDRHEPLCHAQLVARNDVTEAPLSRRLEARVRERLIRELADALKQEARRALGDLGPAVAPSEDALHHATAKM